MFEEDVLSVAGAATKKVEFLKKNPVGYIIASMLAGIFVGIGVLLSFSIGGQLSGSVFTKVLMGLSFGVALSLVVMAGGELFTGNNMVMVVGMAKKTVKVRDAILLWVVCWFGNLTGSVLIALMFYLTGLDSGAVAEFIANSALIKMNLQFFELFFRGVLCNILVCLAIWCTFRCKSEAGKLIMIFWCIFAFLTTGFEHSIANMTLLTVALFNPCGAAVSFTGWLYNLAVCTLGNIVGGALVAGAYLAVSHKKPNKNNSLNQNSETKV